MNLPFVFANPWGALALLGLPAVIAIHCLQQKARVVQTSTLFLLDRLAPDSKEGRRLTWLRSSLAFWLQILAVLVVAWLLMQPRWLEARAVQRVVIVLDSSLSLQAFTGDLADRAAPRLRALAALAPRTYWQLLETDPAGSTLYEGFDLAALEQKLRAWTPSLPAHDPTRALELARSLAPGEAVVVFLTDRPHELPSGVDLLAIGEPIENCGLVGCRLDSTISGTGDDLTWQVLAQNYGRAPAHRSWWIELAGKKTEPQSIDLEPGHPQVLRGKFPPGLDRLEVCLEPDRFALDDRMAIVRPRPKQLTVELLGDDATIDLVTRLVQTLPGLALVQSGERADLDFRTLNPSAPFPGNAISSVILFNAPDDHDAFTGGPFTAEDDPLNQDLNWQGLVAQPLGALALTPQDNVLLWKGGHPLIAVRALPAGRRELVFNFNFPTSNAARLPAFVLLISRFADALREDKQAPEARNAELTEPLIIAADPQGGAVVVRDARDAAVSMPARSLVTVPAPSVPGFFTVTQGGQVLLDGAAQFADARESDFTTAATLDTLAGHRAVLVALHTRADAWAPLWLLLLAVLLALSWTVTSRRTP